LRYVPKRLRYVLKGSSMLLDFSGIQRQKMACKQAIIPSGSVGREYCV
jgi:hypothetical protein